MHICASDTLRAGTERSASGAGGVEQQPLGPCFLDEGRSIDARLQVEREEQPPAAYAAESMSRAPGLQATPQHRRRIANTLEETL